MIDAQGFKVETVRTGKDPQKSKGKRAGHRKASKKNRETRANGTTQILFSKVESIKSIPSCFVTGKGQAGEG